MLVINTVCVDKFTDLPSSKFINYEQGLFRKFVNFLDFLVNLQIPWVKQWFCKFTDYFRKFINLLVWWIYCNIYIYMTFLYSWLLFCLSILITFSLNWLGVHFFFRSWYGIIQFYHIFNILPNTFWVLCSKILIHKRYNHSDFMTALKQPRYWFAGKTIVIYKLSVQKKCKKNIEP